MMKVFVSTRSDGEHEGDRFIYCTDSLPSVNKSVPPPIVKVVRVFAIGFTAYNLGDISDISDIRGQIYLSGFGAAPTVTTK